MKFLRKNDIVGASIAGIYQTKWMRSDNIEACAVYARLATGLLFEISYQEPNDVGIPISDIASSELQPAERPKGMASCISEHVLQVVYCDYWPTLGLKLSSGRVLTCRDWGIPHCIGAYIYVPEPQESVDLVDFFQTRFDPA